MSAQGDQITSPWQRVGSGIHSVVWRTQKSAECGRLPNCTARPLEVELDAPDDLSNWIAVKVVYDNRSMPPHDIVREAAILRDISHTNIIPVLGFVQGGSDVPYALYMPLIPLSLNNLLSSPLFCPSPLTGPYSAFCRPVLAPPLQAGGANLVTLVAKSIIYQLLLAVSYLHSLDPPISHRDINPSNVLIDHEGAVKLVDFGIAWSPRHVQTASSYEVTHVDKASRRHPFDGWTETSDKMTCEVATGPHRSPELLFSPPVYLATAVDLWSLGTTIAQFFTPLRLLPSQSPLSSPISSASDELDQQDSSPFIIPPSLRSKIDYRATWERTTLFNGDRGELGLAWSIFKLRGTPNEESWPTFSSLPDVSKIQFREASPKPLSSVLPHLPVPSPSPDVSDGSTYFPMDRSPESLIDSFLAYPPTSRLPVAQAVHHIWFSADLLLPTSHPGPSPTHRFGGGDKPSTTSRWETHWGGRTLGEWLEPIIKRETVGLTCFETSNA